MPRYPFAKAVGFCLLDQLIAAGLPDSTRVEYTDAACWVTCEPGQLDAATRVVNAHDPAQCVVPLPPQPLLYTVDGSEPPASAALDQYLVDRSPGAQGRGKFSPKGSTAWLSHFDANALAGVANSADTKAAAAQGMVQTIQGRISRVVEVSLNYTSLLGILATKTITIDLDPAMPAATYVPLITRTGGALNLAQVNFSIASRTTTRCVLTAQGLALGILNVSIALIPPYGATATVS